MTAEDSEDLVSVIIPTYNRAYCVVDAVRSTLDQTHAPVECIVVDDGSTDGTVRVLTEVFADEPRLHVLAREHAGVSAARNHGLAHASGSFVTFLDSDDLMVPHRLERQLAWLADGAADAVIGRQEQVLVGAASRPAWLQQHPEWWDEHYHMSILVGTRIVRDMGGFDENLDIGEDLDFMVRLAGAGVHIARLDDVIVTRRYFGDNVTYGMGDDDHHALMNAVRRHLARRRTRIVR
jgi:glycosyltransferase involved in cell wall biosynthesis